MKILVKLNIEKKTRRIENSIKKLPKGKLKKKTSYRNENLKKIKIERKKFEEMKVWKKKKCWKNENIEK